MADRHWVCTDTTGDWNSTANWSATRGGAGGAAVPTTDDDVYVESGTQPLINLSSISAVLGSLTWTADFALGTVANPIIVAVAGTSAVSAKSGVCRVRRTSFVNLKCVGSSGAAGIKKLILELPTNAQAFVGVTGTDGISVASGDYVHIDGGNVTLDGEIAVAAGTALRVAGGLVNATYGTDKFREVIVGSGSRFVTLKTCLSLETEPGATSQTDGTAAIDTKLLVHSNARHTHTSSGTIALSETRPGGLTTVGSTNKSFTLTAKTTWKGSVNFNDASNLINVPTENDVGVQGGGFGGAPFP